VQDLTAEALPLPAAVPVASPRLSTMSIDDTAVAAASIRGTR